MSEAHAVCSAPRLTSLSQGGGSSRRLAPAMLAELLQDSPVAHFPGLLAGTPRTDGAAVYRLGDDQAIVATTDFSMPIVDDPFDFGRIAAASALSDVYALGGRPVLALAVVGMPANVLPGPVIRDILRGGESVCAQAGIPVAGGHSVDCVEPLYGLVALGILDPAQPRPGVAQDGDVLVLGKPLGVGICAAALKKGRLDPAGYRAMVEATTLLNRVGADMAVLPGVHALADVSGTGLLGRVHELGCAAGLGACVQAARLPLLPGVRELAEAGYVTGVSARNWTAYADHVRLDAGVTPAQRAVLTDPQTSGGLLACCAPAQVEQVLSLFQAQGCTAAAVIGRMTAGPGGVSVHA